MAGGLFGRALFRLFFRIILDGKAGCYRSISLLTVLLVLAPILIPVEALASEPSPGRSFEKYLEGVYLVGEPGAAVLVAKNGEILFRKAYGLANLELGVPVTPKSVFQIDSITKLFTATAILKLAEEGVVSLDDSMTRYLDGFPAGADEITLRDLLNHRSGLVNQAKLGKKWLPRVREDFSTQQLLDMFRDEPFDFAPGERTEYNNNNYVVLGAIIEAATGRGYARYLEEAIFAPLGLQHTHYGGQQKVIANRADGYVVSDEGWRNMPFLSMTHPYAAGAVVSNVDDLYTWYRALETGTLIAPATFDRVNHEGRHDDKETAYRLGWFLGELQGAKTISQGGGSAGFASHLMAVPSEGVFVVILSNNPAKQPNPAYLSSRLAGEAMGRSIDEPEEIALPASVLETYVGRYAFESGQVMEIVREDEALYLKTNGSGPIPLYAEGESVFFLKAVEAKIRFVIGGEGLAERLIFSQAGRDIPAERIEGQ